MPAIRQLRRPLPLAVCLWLAACSGPEGSDAGTDARPTDAGAADAPVTTTHCNYEPLRPTGNAGTAVTDAPVAAGAAEGFLHVPLGTTLGAYASRSPFGGNDGFIDERRTDLAGEFAASVGIETWPRVRAVAISTGTAPGYEETVLFLKADLALSSQAILSAVEARLPAELAGKVVLATSHSHGTFANYTTDAMQIAFGPFRQQVFDAIVEDLVDVATRALAARRPARVGIASTDAFDVMDRVSRDRRRANDELPGGDVDDRHAFMIRIDDLDGAPIAMMPLFGIHGTIQGGDNVLVTTDAIGGIERVLEEHFATNVVVMHLQGAGGDTSPVGLESGTTCPMGSVLCHNFARAETVGLRARDELLALYDEAGAAMQPTLRLEMVTRGIERGPDPEHFVVRGGALRYAPWDGTTEADGRVYDEAGAILSPIDEFNAPYGAALCSSSGRDRAILTGGQIPGTRNPLLAGTPYATCNRVESVASLFSTALQVPTTGPPLCDTTRTLISAGRMGDFYFLTVPGEAMVIGNDRMREASPVPEDHLMVIGYAQDHQGYVMTAEDWLRGGYEPTITFWGPLDGEQIMEASLELLDAALTDTREDTASGTDHVAIAMPTERFVPDPAPLAGTVPATPPPYITNRLLPMIPSSADLPASAPRLSSVFFTWIGEDPLEGTPVVTIEEDLDGDGTFEPLVRRSGRVVGDGDFILTWTPDPPSGMASDARTHYWTVEWQLVPPGGDPLATEETELGARLGLPRGPYRIHVDGTGYEVASRPVTVEPAPLAVTLEADTLRVSVQSSSGFRLLDATAGANGVVPLRGASVEAEIAYAGSSETRTLALDGEGRAALSGLAGAVRSIRVTDTFGNTGTLTP